MFNNTDGLGLRLWSTTLRGIMRSAERRLMLEATMNKLVI
jgi:hypothetical protein